jgi:hypothetical protein
MNTFLILLIFRVSIFFAGSPADTIQSYKGRQPQPVIDNAGVVRIAYGKEDSIFCVTSLNAGTTFSKPVLVATVKGMHLGMTRGPQIASSKKYTVVTAMDKSGTIHSFLLNHNTGKWVNQPVVNDVKFSAPEGLMSIAADREDNFYAVWLDTRKNKHNNIFFAEFNPKARKWSKNKLVYESPDGHVCECCKPSVAVNGNHIALMFRNWVDGSRDLFITESFNKGKAFNTARRLGNGTWKLKGCPMDGGGVYIDENNITHTSWQREGIVYYSRPGEDEIKIAAGRSCSITGNGKKLMVLMQDKGVTKYYDVGNKTLSAAGSGSFLKSVFLPDGGKLFTWEEDGQIKITRV